MSTRNGSSRLGTRFGPYELQSVIGVGGMGEVYRAYDTLRERMVAIKLLRPEMAADQSFQERFRRESRIAARLQEPHVIPVHNFGEIDGVLYIDMRLVEGESVKDALRAVGVLPPARAVSIIGQVASALDDAHANGLIHRDIKPENVLLTSTDFAYLVDFGIAHGGGEATVTSTGLVVGSSAYMAPERFNGDRGGPASDIYSLTCLLYETLTGRAPYEAGDVRQVWSAHMFAPPPRPSIMRRGVSRAFDDVIARGMAKQPQDRYKTAGELARAAAAALEAPVIAEPAAPVTPPSTRQYSAVYRTPPPMPAPPAPKSARDQAALIGGIIGLFALAIIFAVILVFGGGGPDPQPRIPASSSSSEAPSSTTTTSAVEGVSGTDSLGFVGHTARCDSGDTPAALIRTSLSLAIICERDSGDFYYRGERLRDGANREIDGARRSGDGFTVTGSDGARYDVQPDQLTISSGGKVDSAEPALEYGSAN
ncbi:serine/threonine-protein kinase [Mycolicibacterium sp. BiH015]|uniref:serine/threonine-protein kinase n=1 Tax=Mycolicibacterium sp. BiH015 TaxID=3018808 RepID=UPI0022E65B9D|nr:serine/threonine-protein kinase [Mycolicibacterium sp. BiH015]MDA2891918.1 serine/threonine-protein kinase [Mycolicibacterium sp. BiH015]